MSIDVRVPATGNSGEDAVIIDWNVTVGAEVRAGDVLVTLETAKATVDVEAPAGGRVLKLMYEPGDEVPEHEVLAILGEECEAASEGARPAGPGSDALDPGATAPATTGPAVEVHEHGVRIAASPRARILAERNGVDLALLSGTGPGGRVIVADVLGHRTVQAPAAPPASVPTVTLDSEAEAEFDLVPVRGARKITAQRMQASLQGTAQVTLTRYADASALLRYVARLRSVTEAAGLPKIGVNDALLFATARALAGHPEANSTFDWDGIRQYRSVHLGFAVDTGQALLVPVIPGADRLSLSGISAFAKAAIEKARTGTLTLPEMEGGTFTVSNLGGLGVHWFTPVLNPPQTGILGIGATHQSHPEGPSLLPLSLTFDHRALDGAAAAAVLADIAKSIETVDVLAAF